MMAVVVRLIIEVICSIGTVVIIEVNSGVVR